MMDQETLHQVIKEVESQLTPDSPEKDAAGVFIPRHVDEMMENRAIKKVIAHLKTFIT